MMKKPKVPFLFQTISGIHFFAFHFLLIAFLFLYWIDPAFGKLVRKPVEEPKTVPGALLKWTETDSQYAVFVDKFSQKVFVYRRDDLSTPVKVYTCSTGENKGPKTKQSDRKTPEGIYFFTHSYEKKDLSPIYGIRAFPIDYPNPIDRKQGKAGYGIWFHGTNKPLKPNDTNGCIVLKDKDIDELASYIRLHDTPVIISSKMEMVHRKDLKEKAGELEQVIEEWRRSWEEKEMEKYMSFYSPRFSSGGKNREEWKRYKTRLAKKYKKIRVETQDLRIFKNGGMVLVMFRQSYRTSRFRSEGIKRLYLMQNSNQWRIVGEFFKEGRIKLATVKKPRPSNREEIKRFIYLWRDAWQNKDLKSYISSYDTKFQSRGMDLNGWERHRKRLNKRYRSLKIEIRDLRIVKKSKKRARVSFKQKYRADGYHDLGIKKMDLIKNDNHWKIQKEEWTPLRKRSRR